MTEQNHLHSLSHWPDWVLSSDEMRRALEVFSSSHTSLLNSIKNDQHHKRVSDAQIAAFIDDAELKRLVDEKARKGFANVAGSRMFSKEAGVVQLYAIAEPLRMLRYFLASKNLALVHFLSAVHGCLQRKNLLVVLILYRSIVEHIAVTNSLLAEISKLADTADAVASIDVLEQADEIVTRRVYATRLDWQKILKADQLSSVMEDQKALRYNKPDHEWDYDRSAEQILNSVDKLGKHVPNIRSVYELLCEFAHPNVGAQLALVQSSYYTVDGNGVQWLNNELAVDDAPLFMAKQAEPVLAGLTSSIGECLRYFLELMIVGDSQCTRLGKHVRAVVRGRLNTDRSVIDPYADCPCAGGQKVKFCCLK